MTLSILRVITVTGIYTRSIQLDCVVMVERWELLLMPMIYNTAKETQGSSNVCVKKDL